MARLLQIFALLCAIAVITTWTALGAHRGWTQTQIATQHVDPITEIPYAEYRPGFRPGLDFLGAGLFGSALLFAAGFGISKLNPRK